MVLLLQLLFWFVAVIVGSSLGGGGGGAIRCVAGGGDDGFVPVVFVSVVMSVLTVVAGVAAVATDDHSGGYSNCSLLNSMNACNNTHDSQIHEGDRERYLTLHAFFCVDLLSKLNLFVDYQ